MEHWIAWLNANSGAVTALAAVAGVLVATVYSVVTWLLWRATREQGMIAREVFEASHRPHLSVMPSWWINLGTFTLRCQLRNDGTVPAYVTALHVTIGLAQHWVPEREIITTVETRPRTILYGSRPTVPPGGSEITLQDLDIDESQFVLENGQRAGGVTLEVAVDHRGAGQSEYTARARLNMVDPFTLDRG